MWRRIFTITLFLILLLFSSADGRERKIALLMKAAINPFFIKMKEGAEAYALEHGISLETFSLEFETDVEKQISIMKELIMDEKHGVIILAPTDSYRLVPVVKTALQRGVQVINIDNKLDRDTLKEYGIQIPFIGPDNFAAAKKVGTYVRFKLKGKGNVLIFEGLAGAENAILRKKGFVSGLGGGNIHILGYIPGEWHRDKAFNETISYFKTHREKVDAILCANDEMALGVVQALSLLDKKDIIVTGYDNLREVRLLMREKKIYATVEQNPYLMGYLGVKSAKMLMDNKKIPLHVEVPTTLVTYETFGKKVGIVLSQYPGKDYRSFIEALNRFALTLGEDIIYGKRGATPLSQINELIKRKVDAIIFVSGKERVSKEVIKIVKDAQIPLLILRPEGALKPLGIKALKMLRDYFIGWYHPPFHFNKSIIMTK